MTWFQSPRALKLSWGLTIDEDLPGLMVAASVQLALDELVPGVRWMKWGAPFSLFIGFYTFCGHLRWEWVGGDTSGVKVPSCNDVRQNHPLMTGKASCVSQGWEGQKFILQRSTTSRELSRDTLLWFSMMCLWTLSEAASDMCSVLMACGKIEAWQSMSTMCFDFWIVLSPFFLPDSLTRDHSTKHSRSCYINKQTK